MPAPGKTLLVSLLLCLTAILPACRPARDAPRLAAHTLRADDRILRLAGEARFDTIVQVLPWREIEPTQNQFHWQTVDELVAAAEYYGLRLVARLDQPPDWAVIPAKPGTPPVNLDDYEDFVHWTATRYRGRIAAYIIWNEPNLSLEWAGYPPDPAAYSRLLRRAYTTIKQADPQALVVAAGLAPTNDRSAQALDERLFLERLLQAGASPYFDVLAAHPYSFGQPPDAPARDDRHPAFARLEDLHRILASHGDRARPVWITEMGWTVSPPDDQPDIGVTPQQQAQYLVDALEMVRRRWPWVELVTVWNLSIPAADDPFAGYSLLDADGQPRPAYHAWRQAVAGWAVGPSRQVDQPPVVPILPRGNTVHLGDSDLPPPWFPLYGGRRPALSWSGSFYLVDPGQSDWFLLLELMQQNEVGVLVAVNGHPLFPDLPQQDLARRWLTVRLHTPAAVLQAGYNRLTITTARLLPDAQQPDFTWDDFQLRNIRLCRNSACE